jgi:hypothetical protein
MLSAKVPAAALALTLLLILTPTPATPAEGPTLAAPLFPNVVAQPADTVVGTVRSVREGAGVEVVTGFHLALKVVYVRVDPETRIEVEGQPARLGDLQPGQVVRVRYDETDAGKMAQMIESVRPAGEGGRP